MWLVAFWNAIFWLRYGKLTASVAHFSAVVTVLGVIFGLLQYYFSRHEEKVQQKLVDYFTSITLPIDEFSFSEFLNFVEEKREHKDVFSRSKAINK